MKVFTITSTDELGGEPLNRCVAGSYTTWGQALSEFVEYIVRRLGMRSDLAWSMAHDYNHLGAAELFSRRKQDGVTVIRKGCIAKLKAFIRRELDGQHCYYVFDGSSRWHFDIDENDVEGQLWTTVTWGDSDCEDPEFTTPFPETFVSQDKAIENFYQYALDLKQQHGIGVSEGFRTFVYDTLRTDGKCQVDLDDGCCVSCVLYSTPVGGICK